MYSACECSYITYMCTCVCDAYMNEDERALPSRRRQAVRSSAAAGWRPRFFRILQPRAEE